ncbi:uncharacterized protein [Nicotiana tomentosiformis]|uniref:uncharacterized protein n=1 Tax=Nicotiana tomentosiformis TaxID=4098 RepID=UPI00388C6B4B
MDKAHPLSTPMVVRSLDINKDPFQLHENNGELLGDKTPYLSAIRTLMYLENNTRPDITFAMQVICLTHIEPDLKQAIYLLMETKIPTILYEDNAAYIAQPKMRIYQRRHTKHISPKFFFTHDLQQNSEIDVQQIRSSDNLADLITKALPTSTFEKLRHKIKMHRFRDIK